jgi:hypothetical protein
MYRRTNKHQKKLTESYTNRSKNEQRLENTEDVRPVQVIPKLRRVIDITDYDSGQPAVHPIELRKCDRIDCYDGFVDGELWKRPVGWSNILTGIRKAIPRLARE